MPSSDCQHTDAIQREAAQHPGISGTYHRHGRIEWVDPEDLNGLLESDYARPMCPVTQLASADEKVGCEHLGERVTAENGRGAWYCGWHGTFRIYDYPRSEPKRTEQATLLADGGV